MHNSGAMEAYYDEASVAVMHRRLFNGMLNTHSERMKLSHADNHPYEIPRLDGDHYSYPYDAADSLAC